VRNMQSHALCAGVSEGLEIYIDGASKGNPGPSGVGVVVCRNGETIKNISTFIGRATNNVAEYSALIYALEEARKLRAEILTIKTDSQLLHRQMRRLYKVKHPSIIALFSQAQQLVSVFRHVSIEHIPREENRGADKLATLAIKKELQRCSLKT
jgi:ribonuclease HI